MLEPTIVTWIIIIFVVIPKWVKIPAEKCAVQLTEGLNVIN